MTTSAQAHPAAVPPSGAGEGQSITTWYVNFGGHWIPVYAAGAAFWLDRGFSICLAGTFAPAPPHP